MRRMLRSLIWMMLILSSVSLAGRAWAAGLPNEIAAKYGPAVKAMQQLYSRATVKGTLNREFPQSEKSLRQRFVYRVDGSKVRLDVTTLNRQKLGAPVGAKRMYMATPDGALDTIQGTDSPTFDDAHEETYTNARSRMESMCRMTYPYALNDRGTLYDMLQSPDLKIVRVEKIKQKDLPMVKISYIQTVANGESSAPWKSWLLLSPSEGWGLRAFSQVAGEGDNAITYRGTLSYSEVRDGVPLVHNIECVKERGQDATCLFRETVTISEFIPGSPSNYYFTADAF